MMRCDRCNKNDCDCQPLAVFGETWYLCESCLDDLAYRHENATGD